MTSDAYDKLILKEAQDEENVTDDAEDEQRQPVKFNITAFGADPSVFDLVRRLEKERLVAPPFQRAYVWSVRDASRFIESLLMGLPVPGLFVFRDVEKEKDLIIDGQQRLLTLKYFADGIIRNQPFKLVDVAEPWNGKLFNDLDDLDKSRIEESTIHVTYFKQDHPQENDRSIYEVFERINTGGLKLSAQEIRTCVSHGAFVELLNKLNSLKSWRQIYGPQSPRLKDVELILRFLAFNFKRENYKRPMRRFLDDFLYDNRKLSGDLGIKFTEAFASAIDFALEAIGEKAFRPQNTLNSAVFDSVMIGLSERKKEQPKYNKDKIKSDYENLLKNAEYKQAYTRATADEESVKVRLKLAIGAFSDA
jgi:hypothetical protein